MNILSGICGISDVDSVYRMIRLEQDSGVGVPGLYNDRKRTIYCENQFITAKIGVFILGEIDNYELLKARLLSENVSLESDLSAEVVSLLFSKNGLDLFQELEGDFSIVVQDFKNAITYLHSSLAGDRGLFYSLSADPQPFIIFSSDLESILRGQKIKTSLDDARIYQYLHSNITLNTHETFFKNIEHLDPGELAIWKNGTMQFRKSSPTNQAMLFDSTFADLRHIVHNTAQPPRIEFIPDLQIKKGFFSFLEAPFKQRNIPLLDQDFKTRFSENIEGSKVLGDAGFTIKQSALSAARKDLFVLLLDSRFANRPYWSQKNSLRLLQDIIDGSSHSPGALLRIVAMEIWFRSFLSVTDSESTLNQIFANRARQKKIIRISSNKSKPVKRVIKDSVYFRFPLKTDVIKRNDDIAAKVGRYVIAGLRELGRLERYKELKKERWFIVVSEKIVAIAQGRSKFIWEINPGFWAKLLSRYVTKTKAGIGLGSPWTMQLAIEEVGIFRILIAAFIGAITKYIGIKGMFYYVAGGAASAIDGPTDYSLYPSNVSAKLAPKNPKRMAKEMTAYLRNKLPKTRLNSFDGVAIIDANDIGQKVLGNDTAFKSKLIRNIFQDNPMGQTNEQTPITIVFFSSNT